tara:strand:+ start:4232 stop:4378 length:147 start_codon:yes stop_codon:yes gene_type:complete
MRKQPPANDKLDYYAPPPPINMGATTLTIKALWKSFYSLIILVNYEKV